LPFSRASPPSRSRCTASIPIVDWRVRDGDAGRLPASSRGYRTVCVHPYAASFYSRDKVYPQLGFDEFIDLRAFAGAPKSGPYVSDLAVAERVCSLLSARLTSRPLFVFVITMENHGPLHLEKVHPGDAERFYSTPPPPAAMT
jgi:phosphoglycerol transferase MdoB-like AlkP superfamily enzyme